MQILEPTIISPVTGKNTRFQNMNAIETSRHLTKFDNSAFLQRTKVGEFSSLLFLFDPNSIAKLNTHTVSFSTANFQIVSLVCSCARETSPCSITAVPVFEQGAKCAQLKNENSSRDNENYDVSRKFAVQTVPVVYSIE